jgi:hypothetical protein
MMRNNTVHDAYYQHGCKGAAIVVYASAIDDEPSGVSRERSLIITR